MPTIVKRPSKPANISSAEGSDENVLDRLRRMTRIARQYGFEVRGAPLEGAGCTWCEIRGRRVLFLDLSQPAAEQALAIREILDETASVRPHSQAA
ncbi:MAG: hypothetical protein ACF8CQ_05150 [Rhodopirellula sp. JB044]|uniref:hypothetical protein n=1 Tax=Rhodopirellula sp. JB044 TaxID=3342844 RepID=UPI00370CBC73